MDCRRAEELFSDHLEGSLAAPLLRELEAHLSGCPHCAELRRALPDVLDALRALGQDEVEAPAGLAERVAAASFARRASLRPARAVGLPGAWQAAAVFVAAVSAWMLAGSLSPSSTRRLTTRLVERSVNTGVYLLERKERLFEEVRFLNAVVGTAFEERVDRMSERVEDYRRLLGKKPAAAAPAGKRSGGNFPNPALLRCVETEDGRAAGGVLPGRRSPRRSET